MSVVGVSSFVRDKAPLCRAQTSLVYVCQSLPGRQPPPIFLCEFSPCMRTCLFSIYIYIKNASAKKDAYKSRCEKIYNRRVYKKKMIINHNNYIHTLRACNNWGAANFCLRKKQINKNLSCIQCVCVRIYTFYQGVSLYKLRGLMHIIWCDLRTQKVAAINFVLCVSFSPKKKKVQPHTAKTSSSAYSVYIYIKSSIYMVQKTATYIYQKDKNKTSLYIHIWVGIYNIYI